MTLRWNSGEGPNGTTVTAANSDDIEGDAFDSVTTNGQTIAYTTSSPIRGTSSIRCASATAASSAFWQTNDTAAAAVAMRWYEKWTTWPSALQQNGINIRGSSGATTIGRRNINTDGTFSISLATTSGNSTTVLTTGSVFRFECVVTALNGAAGVMTIRVFSGHSLTALEQLQLTGQTTALTCDAIRWGKINGAGTHDQMLDDLAWDIGRTTEIGPAVQTISIFDTLTHSEGVSNIAQATVDVFSLSELPASMIVAATALDDFTLTETITDTSAADVNDVITQTEGTSSITVAAQGNETFTQGDDTANSIPTGAQAISWGSGLSNDYVIATDVDASDLVANDKAMLFTGAGALKENVVFKITGISAPFSGFVNVSITPAATVLPAAGDVLKVVTPAGASLLQTSNLTDTFTLDEQAVVSQTISATDSATLTDVSSLAIFTSIAASETHTLIDVAAVVDVQAKTAVDTQTLTGEVSSLAQSQSPAASETHTMTETSSLVPSFAVVDSAVQSEGTVSLTSDGNAADSSTVNDDTYLLDMSTAASDTMTQTEAPTAGFASTVASETHTLSEVSALQIGIATTDTATQTEGTTGLAAASSTTDSLTQTEGATSIAAAVSASETHTLSESSALDAGGIIATADTFTMTESASVTVDHARTDDFGFTDVAALNEQRLASDTSTLADTVGALVAIITSDDDATLDEVAVFEEGDFYSKSDVFIMSEVSELTKITDLSAVDSATMTETAVLTVVVEATDEAMLFEQADGVVYVAASDLHTLLENASVGADSLFITEQRRLTHTYIMENPVQLHLLPHARLRTPSGGYVLQDGTVRAVQTFRLIESSSTVVTDPLKTTDGWMRTRTWQLMGEWNAEIEPDDTFQHDGRTWTVLSMMPENGYEIRAQVERVGE